MKNELGYCLVILTEQAWSITHSILLIWYKGFSRLHSPGPLFIPAQASQGRKYWLCDTNPCAACILWVCEYSSLIYWELQLKDLKKKFFAEYVIFIIRSVTILYQGGFRRFQRFLSPTMDNFMFFCWQVSVFDL